MRGQPIDGICPAHGEPEPCQPCANLVTRDGDATEEAEGLTLSGRIEPSPLRHVLTLEAIGDSPVFEHRQPRVRRAPNPDGRSWRAEDEI